MDRLKLNSISETQKEITDLEKRIDRIKKQSEFVADIVQNGYKGHAKIYGVDLIRKRKLDAYEEKLKNFHQKLLEQQEEMEEYIETIENADIRRIFRYRYIDNLNWVQIQIKMRL